VERQIRESYAYDDRFHGEIERRARAALAGRTSASEMQALGGDYAVTTFELRPAGGSAAERAGGALAVGLEAEEWSEWSRSRRFRSDVPAGSWKRRTGSSRRRSCRVPGAVRPSRR